MKKIICLAIIASISLSSCMWSSYFGKRPLFLVGAPDDIQVKQNGKKVDVREETMARSSTGPSSARIRTKYRHAATLVRVRRNNKIELSSGGKTVELKFKGKPAKGIVFLVLETPFTLGIGTIVDLATRSFYYPATKYIDVNAAFNNTTPKSKKELKKIAMENSTIITEW